MEAETCQLTTGPVSVNVDYDNGTALHSTLGSRRGCERVSRILWFSSCADLAPELAIARRLVGGQPAQQPCEDGEGQKGGYRHPHGDGRAAEDRHHQPGNAHTANVAQPEGVVPKEVKGDAPAQRNGRDST